MCLEVYNRNKYCETVLKLASCNRQICPVGNPSQNLKVTFPDLLNGSQPTTWKALRKTPRPLLPDRAE